MNIFLSNNRVSQSVQDLDDLRLQKQLVEVYQLLSLAIKEQKVGHEIKAGHYHHPVYLFYKDNIPFLTYYGYECCREYYYRFEELHSLTLMFDDEMHKQGLVSYKAGHIGKIDIPKFTPYYMEGSKGQPNYIRTTENVSALFQQKLINKWDNDKAKGRQPKWTNRQVPEFYKREINNGNSNM